MVERRGGDCWFYWSRGNWVGGMMSASTALLGVMSVQSCSCARMAKALICFAALVVLPASK